MRMLWISAGLAYHTQRKDLCFKKDGHLGWF